MCLLYFCVICVLFIVRSVLWYCWLGLLTCKNRRPYNLYCVGGDVKPCSINQFDVFHFVFFLFSMTADWSSKLPIGLLLVWKKHETSDVSGNSWTCYKYTIKYHTCPSLFTVCEPRSSCCEDSGLIVLRSVHWSYCDGHRLLLTVCFCAICGSDFSYSVSLIMSFAL